MDIMTFIVENIDLLNALICVGIGMGVKKIKFIDNDLIIPINMLMGTLIAICFNSFVVDKAIITQGVCSGLTATGMYEFVRNIGNRIATKIGGDS